MNTKFQIIILAAGEGKRMQTGVPKVMNLLRRKPLIDYVVTAAEKAFGVKPVVVVNNKHTLVQDYLGNRAEYAVQVEQLGTGHAVMSAEALVKDRAENIIVLYGDMPCITNESLKRLAKEHLTQNNTLTVMTLTAENFDDWRSQFADFGRIIRDKNGGLLKVVEKKDASPEELAISEVNTSYFCFKADWLWENLKKLQNNNQQKEYYLVDLVKMALEQGKKLNTLSVPAEEAIGINTKEHLELAEKIVKS